MDQEVKMVSITCLWSCQSTF